MMPNTMAIRKYVNIICPMSPQKLSELMISLPPLFISTYLFFFSILFVNLLLMLFTIFIPLELFSDTINKVFTLVNSQLNEESLEFNNAKRVEHCKSYARFVVEDVTYHRNITAFA